MIQLNENSFKGIRQKTKALVPLTGSMERAPLPQTQHKEFRCPYLLRHTQNNISRNQQRFLRVEMGIGASDTQKLPSCTPRALGSGKAEFLASCFGGVKFSCQS